MSVGGPLHFRKLSSEIDRAGDCTGSHIDIVDWNSLFELLSLVIQKIILLHLVVVGSTACVSLIEVADSSAARAARGASCSKLTDFEGLSDEEVAPVPGPDVPYDEK